MQDFAVSICCLASHIDLHLDLQEADSDAEEDLTVTHKKHLRFFGVRWKYLKVFLAIMWCLCFVAAAIVLRRKVRSVVCTLLLLCWAQPWHDACFTTSVNCDGTSSWRVTAAAKSSSSAKCTWSLRHYCQTHVSCKPTCMCELPEARFAASAHAQPSV